MKFDLYFTPYKKINLKWVKLLEENIEVNLNDVEFGHGFSAITPKPQTTANKNASIGFHQN